MFEQVSLEVGGRTLSFETGKMARQAHGSVVVRYGDTVVLATACMDSKPTEKDFLPLTVDYREYTYSAGKIPGGFFKREGRPTEREILTSRLIDRPLRPLFPEGWSTETQIVAMVLSADSENDPDVIGVTAASAALYISKLPFANPVACVRVGLIDGKLVVNPTVAQQKTSLLNIVIAGTQDAIVMVESGALEVSEDTVVDALEFGHAEVRKIVEQIKALQVKVNQAKVAVTPPAFDEALYSQIKTKYTDRMRDALDTAKHPKLESYGLVDAIHKEILDAIPEEDEDKRKLANRAFERLRERIFRDDMLLRRRRPDARAFDQLRQITCEAGVLPRTHGSALFTRGQTQALSVVTIGSGQDQQKIDGLGLETFKRFMHHYNFPPFSVGEARPLRSPGRREIGHGALAERAVHNVMPDEEAFPYVVRIVTEILSSNGSTSMASVCGSCLALMDAGVPLVAPVAGIAMGLITDEGAEHAAILSDIQGMEDALGDMDFKVAGSETGITALQMDCKISGLSWDLMERALEQARVGRLHILGKMREAIATPREELSRWAPRIEVININPDKIRDVIGPGGKMIRKIVEETGCQIDVEDDGRVFIASANAAAREQAMAMIHDLTDDIEIGRIYKGKVSRLMGFGAFVEIMPKKEGLVRIGQLAEHHVDKVEDVVNVGDEIMVKVIEVDDRGRVNLSRREAIRELSRQQQEAAGNGAGGPA